MNRWGVPSMTEHFQMHVTQPEHCPTHVTQPEPQTIGCLVVANSKTPICKRVLLHSLEFAVPFAPRAPSKLDIHKEAGLETLRLSLDLRLILPSFKTYSRKPINTYSSPIIFDYSQKEGEIQQLYRLEKKDFPPSECPSLSI